MTLRAVHLAALLLVLTCCERTEIRDGADGTLDSDRRASAVAFWSAYRSGRSHMIAGVWAEARDSIVVAVQINPEHEGALYDLGNVSFELGDYRGAESAWRQLVTHHPNSVKGYAQLGALYSCGATSAPFDLSEAERFFTTMYDLNKESMEATTRLGEVFLLQGRTDDAISRFNQAIAFDPAHREAWILKGLALWIRGDRDESLRVYAGSKPRQTAERPFASEEGDTRTGSDPMLAASSGRRSFFQNTLSRALAGETAEIVYVDALVAMRRR